MYTKVCRIKLEALGDILGLTSYQYALAIRSDSRKSLRKKCYILPHAWVGCNTHQGKL